MEVNKIYQENCLDTLARMPDAFLDCVVTSPPYYGLRSYGTEPQVWGNHNGCDHVWGEARITTVGRNDTGERRPNFNPSAKGYGGEREVSSGNFCQNCNAWRGELGLEPTFQLYLSHLTDIFREIKRALKPTGTVWVNLGDSFSSQGGPQVVNTINSNRVGGSDTQNGGKSRSRSTGLMPKSLMNIPARFAIAMTDELQFIQRNNIIWHKPACMPSSAKDRFTVDFENIFFFTKSPKYWFEQQLEPLVAPTITHRTALNGFGSGELGNSVRFGNSENGRNMRTTWTVNFEPSGEKDGVKSSRLVRVPSDAVSGDTKHIVFPDCLTCADRLAQVASALCDEPLTSTSKRIGRIDDCLVRGQVFGFDSFVRRLVSDSAAGSCGSFLREYFHSATGHSTENHRTLREILEPLSDSSFAEILESIADRQDGLLLSALYLGTRGNSISLDGFDVRLLARIPHYTAGKSECSYCQLYHVKTETAQHYASYPTKLVEIPIRAGCPPGGIVYDCFGGTATTAVAAHKLGRDWICSELQPKYAEIAGKRLEPYLAQPSLI